MSFFEELKRRNVFRVGIAYAITAWVLIQVLDIFLLRARSRPSWPAGIWKVLFLSNYTRTSRPFQGHFRCEATMAKIEALMRKQRESLAAQPTVTGL